MSLPHSSACVERVFSAINLNKKKLRNRLSTKALYGLLHSKQLINKSTDKTCYNYYVPNIALDNHNATMYLPK